MKLNKTREDKYRQSLKSWGDSDNRPFIRVTIDKERDEFDYERKRQRILDKKQEISEQTGDPIDKIHIHDKWGTIG